MAETVRQIASDEQGDSPRILVVEDEVIVRAVVQDCLEELGYEVECAGTAAEAIARATGVRIEAAIVDVGLPGVRGDVLVEQLRSLHPDLPVIVTTGYMDTDIPERFRLQRGVEFVGKPYSALELKPILAALGVREP
jgi:CheY-like chemotaxis protein